MCTTNKNKPKKKYTHPPMEDSSKLEDFEYLEYSKHLIDYKGNIGYSNEGFPVDVIGINFGNGENMFVPANNYEIEIRFHTSGPESTLTIRAVNLSTGECKMATHSHTDYEALREQIYPFKSQDSRGQRNNYSSPYPNQFEPHDRLLDSQFWDLELSSYGEPRVFSSGGGTFKEKALDGFINYVESTIDGLTYTLSSMGGELKVGFINAYNDFKYNGSMNGQVRYPRCYNSYAYGFSFENGFKSERIGMGAPSWENGKRVINGTLGIVLLPVELGRTGYRGIDFLIDQVITNGIGFGVGKGLDKIPNQ